MPQSKFTMTRHEGKELASKIPAAVLYPDAAYGYLFTENGDVAGVEIYDADDHPILIRCLHFCHDNHNCCDQRDAGCDRCRKRDLMRNVTAKDGLLWRGPRMINLPEADRVAEAFGFQCAEALVRHLGGDK